MRIGKSLVPFVVALLLAFVWIILQGKLELPELLFGFGVGLLAWWMSPSAETPIPSESEDSKRIPNPIKVLKFSYFFVYYIIKANWDMVISVLKSTQGFDHLKPAIIAYPTTLKRASEITVLANWITLTPGTLTIEITPQGDRLFVHTTDMGESREAFIAEIRKLERHVEELFS